MSRYAFSLLVAVDQFVNALLGGYADETISFRAARARNKGERWGCVLCALLDDIVKDHCSNTVLSKLTSLRMRGLT